MTGDLFSGAAASPPARRATAELVGGAPDPRSPAYLHCPCGAWASFGFGVSFLDKKPGVRRCSACATIEGRLQPAGDRPASAAAAAEGEASA